MTNVPSVLIVDDDPSYLSIVTHALGEKGLSFHVERTGLGALRSSTKEVFPVVLLDLHLPDVDGLKVLEQFRGRSYGASVILISGAGSIGSAVQAMKLGAADFLEKPIDMIELLDTIASAFAGRLPPAQGAASSIATELATMMLQIVQAPADVKTCDDWARLAGVSRAVLFARCERVGVRGKQALDLGRLLRVATHGPSSLVDLDGLLGNRDHRTVTALLARAGLRVADLRTGPGEVLRRQKMLEAPGLIEALSANRVPG